MNIIIKNTHIKYCERDLNYFGRLLFIQNNSVFDTTQKTVSVLRAPFIHKKSQLKFTRRWYKYKFSFYIHWKSKRINKKAIFDFFFISFFFLRISIVKVYFTKYAFCF